MENLQNIISGVQKTALIILLISAPLISKAQQKTGFGIHFDPAISWMSTDVKEIKNEGTRPGYSFGLTVNRYFTPNYSFSTGISILNAGGRVVSNDTTYLELTNLLAKVLPGKPVVYKIQYITIPIGLKLQTNQIGYLTFFADIGLDPKVVIGRKVDIRSLDISDEKANNELKIINLGYHLTAGMEYSMGGNTAIVLGLNFDNNFLDITKDNGPQLNDRVTQKILSFRIGVNF